MAGLITLDEYKILEGVTSTQYDEKLDQLITSVSQLVRTYCNNEFDTYATGGGFTEEFDIQWSTHVVQLTKSPVISITNVYERLGYSSAYVELFSSNSSPVGYSWYLDSVADSVIRTTESGGYKNFPCGVGSVKITYLAGFAVLPTDLQLAVADIITYYHLNEHKDRQSIGSATRENAGTSSIRYDPGFPDHIRRVLDMYRTS